MSATPPPGWQPQNDPTRTWLTAPPPQPRRSDKPVGWGLFIFGVLALMALNNPNTRTTTGGGPAYVMVHIGAELLIGVWPIVGGIRLLGRHNREMTKWRKVEIAAEDARAAQIPGQRFPGQPYAGQPYAGQPYPGQPYARQQRGAQQFPPVPPAGHARPYAQPATDPGTTRPGTVSADPRPQASTGDQPRNDQQV